MKYYLAVSEKNKIIAVIVIACLLFSCIFLWIESALRPAVFAIAEAKINRVAVAAISRTVSAVIEKEKFPLVQTTADENGKVILIQPDTVRFNTLTADITKQLETEIEAISNIPISIPLGQALGTALLANCGPDIPIIVKPTGKILVSPQDTFQHVGINQTKHRMYLDISVDIRIVIPLAEESATVKAAVPIAEYIIVGDVPQTYVEMPNNILK